jgi:hypothetical protein
MITLLPDRKCNGQYKLLLRTYVSLNESTGGSFGSAAKFPSGKRRAREDVGSKRNVGPIP